MFHALPACLTHPLPKIKLKMKEHHFNTLDDIQMELQAVLDDDLQEKDIHNACEVWEMC